MLFDQLLGCVSLPVLSARLHAVLITCTGGRSEPRGRAGLTPRSSRSAASRRCFHVAAFRPVTMTRGWPPSPASGPAVHTRDRPEAEQWRGASVGPLQPLVVSRLNCPLGPGRLKPLGAATGTASSDRSARVVLRAPAGERERVDASPGPDSRRGQRSPAAGRARSSPVMLAVLSRARSRESTGDVPRPHLRCPPPAQSTSILIRYAGAPHIRH